MPPHLPWVLVREILSYSPCFGLTPPKLSEARSSLVDRGTLYKRSVREAAARLAGSMIYVRGGLHLRILAPDALWYNFRHPSNMGVIISEWTRPRGSALWKVLLVKPCGSMMLFHSFRTQLDGRCVESLGQQLPGTTAQWEHVPRETETSTPHFRPHVRRCQTWWWHLCRWWTRGCASD
jgi:hypothetical protein